MYPRTPTVHIMGSGITLLDACTVVHYYSVGWCEASSASELPAHPSMTNPSTVSLSSQNDYILCLCWCVVLMSSNKSETHWPEGSVSTTPVTTDNSLLLCSSWSSCAILSAKFLPIVDTRGDVRHLNPNGVARNIGHIFHTLRWSDSDSSEGPHSDIYSTSFPQTCDVHKLHVYNLLIRQLVILFSRWSNQRTLSRNKN